MLGDPETSKAPAGQLMSEESSLASKWVAASVEHMLPAGVEDTLQAGGAAEGPSSASAVPGTVLMETAGVGGGGG